MKRALIAIGVVIGGFALLSIITATPLVGEVVTLHTRGADAEWETTPLWIVEIDGSEYLRAGQPEGSGWVTRLRANPEVRLERDGQLREVRLIADGSQLQLVNQKMSERYGWADDFVGLMGDRSGSLPFRIEPAQPPASPH